jgi:hypothetical protein
LAICRCHFACFKDDHDCIGARAFEVRVDEVRARAKIGLQNLVYNIRRLVTLERELFGEMPFFYHSVHLQLSTQWGEGTEELSQMCDYSLHTAKHRPAKVGDRLVTRNFNTGTRGFAALEDARTAVCVLPGTELAFEKEVRSARIGLFGCVMISADVGVLRAHARREAAGEFLAIDQPVRLRIGTDE